MKKTNLLKRAVSITAAAAMGCIFVAAVYAEAPLDENNTIQFSPYKIYKGIETRVTGASVELNKVYVDSYMWRGDQIGPYTSEAYNGGTYFISNTSAGNPTKVTVKLTGVPEGTYTLKQYIPGGSLKPENHTDICTITVLSGSEIKYTDDSNFCTATLGAFNEIAKGLELSGDVTITYYVPGGTIAGTNSNRYFRFDEVQLVQTEAADVIPEISITNQPQDISIALGQDAGKLSVEASGEDLTYQWYKKTDSGGDIKIEGATSAEYAPVYDGEYYVEVSAEGAEPVTSNMARVTFTSDSSMNFTTGYSSGVYENGSKGVIRFMAKTDIGNVSEYGFMYSWQDSDGREVISTDTRISKKEAADVSEGFTADINEIDMASENISISARAFVHANGITYISAIIDAAVDSANEVEYIN